MLKEKRKKEKVASCLRDQTETFFGRTGSSLSMGERDFSYKKVIKEITICITVFIQYYTVRSVALQTALWATDRTVGGPGWMGDLESGTMKTIDHHTFFLPYRPLWLEQPGLVSW